MIYSGLATIFAGGCSLSVVRKINRIVLFSSDLVSIVSIMYSS